MMICKDCNETYSDDEVPTYEENFGFETGVGWKSHKQTFIDKCKCGGEIVEAKQCSDCFGWFPKNELDENDLCYDCKKERELEGEENNGKENDN